MIRRPAARPVSSTLLVLDEAWVFLDNPLFAARIREWLKILRKKNVSVVFATQSLADISESSIAPAIVESCPQRIFLANDRAAEPQARAAYERFGLNARQVAAELLDPDARKSRWRIRSPSLRGRAQRLVGSARATAAGGYLGLLRS